MLTITLEPGQKGQTIATSTDGTRFNSHTPLLTAARHWLENGAPPDTYLCTIWSSDSTEWATRAPIGQAAKYTVDETKTPRFKLLPTDWNPRQQGNG